MYHNEHLRVSDSTPDVHMGWVKELVHAREKIEDLKFYWEAGENADTRTTVYTVIKRNKHRSRIREPKLTLEMYQSIFIDRQDTLAARAANHINKMSLTSEGQTYCGRRTDQSSVLYTGTC